MSFNLALTKDVNDSVCVAAVRIGKFLAALRHDRKTELALDGERMEAHSAPSNDREEAAEAQEPQTGARRRRNG